MQEKDNSFGNIEILVSTEFLENHESVGNNTDQKNINSGNEKQDLRIAAPHACLETKVGPSSLQAEVEAIQVFNGDRYIEETHLEVEARPNNSENQADDLAMNADSYDAERNFLDAVRIIEPPMTSSMGVKWRFFYIDEEK